MMISSQCSAQLVARLTGPAETETKTTVSHRGSASAFDQPRSSTEAELRLLKKIQLKENIASYTKPSWRDPRILAGYFRQVGSNPKSVANVRQRSESAVIGSEWPVP